VKSYRSSFDDENSGALYGLGCGGTIRVLMEAGDSVDAVMTALCRSIEQRAEAYPDLQRDLLQKSFAPARNNNLVPKRVKGFRHASPDAGTSSRDEDRVPGKFHFFSFWRSAYDMHLSRISLSASPTRILRDSGAIERLLEFASQVLPLREIMVRWFT